MIKITSSGVIVVEGSPDLYVKDEDYLLLIRNSEAREALMRELGVTSIIVDRLGDEVVPETAFEKKQVSVSLPNFPIKREVGYYHRLRTS